jgi:hypothetical protein
MPFPVIVLFPVHGFALCVVLHCAPAAASGHQHSAAVEPVTCAAGHVRPASSLTPEQSDGDGRGSAWVGASCHTLSSELALWPAAQRTQAQGQNRQVAKFGLVVGYGLGLVEHMLDIS